MTQPLPQNPHASLDEPDIPFHAVVEQSVVGIYILQDECFVYVNRHWAEMIGYTVQEMTGGHLSRFVPQDFLGEVLRLYYLRLNNDPPSIHFITHAMHRLGHELRIEVHGTRVMYRGRPAVVGVGVDVTDRLRHEVELKESQELLQKLAGYTRAKLDEQRQQFSRDVHDVLGGMLSSIRMDATRILKRVNNEELADITNNLIALTQQTIETVRQIAADLRPGDLQHLELSSVIQRDLDLFTQRSGITSTLDADVVPLNLSPRRATVVYRIFQEALTNISSHAKATSIKAGIRIDGHQLVFQLTDNGIGFNPEMVRMNALGLLGMKERALEIGAELKITSEPGRGTCLTLTAPLI